MKAWERERRLLERLQEQGSLALTEACALTGASVATTRRDFELLQEKGLAQRTHGGLQLPKKEEPKGYLQGTAILNHTDEEKYRIAQEAAASVKAGESVFLGAGKTCNMLASMLQNVERLTVVTTSITAVLELAECPNASVTLLGGDVHAGKNYIETLDPDISHVLRGFYFDKVFITVDGIDLERGYTVNNKNQIGLYTQLAVLHSGRQRKVRPPRLCQRFSTGKDLPHDHNERRTAEVSGFLCPAGDPLHGTAV